MRYGQNYRIGGKQVLFSLPNGGALGNSASVRWCPPRTGSRSPAVVSSAVVLGRRLDVLKPWFIEPGPQQAGHPRAVPASLKSG